MHGPGLFDIVETTYLPSLAGDRCAPAKRFSWLLKGPLEEKLRASPLRAVVQDASSRRTMSGCRLDSKRWVVRAVVPRRSFLSPVRMENELLDPPIQQFSDVQHILGRTSNLVNPSELIKLLA
jgi:hypothetical protein